VNIKDIKPHHKRKPKESTPHAEILSMVAKETGYAGIDIDKVIRAWVLTLRSELMDRKSVRIRHIGTIFPMVQPPRRVTNMGGDANNDYEDMIMQARWHVKFQPDGELVNQIRDIMVTKKDLEKIYYKK
jgi:nucleoid DNA-binding protein